MEHMGDMEGVAIVMKHMEHTKHTEDLGIDTAGMGAALVTEAMADMEDPRVRKDAADVEAMEIRTGLKASRTLMNS